MIWVVHKVLRGVGLRVLSSPFKNAKAIRLAYWVHVDQPSQSIHRVFVAIKAILDVQNIVGMDSVHSCFGRSTFIRSEKNIEDSLVKPLINVSFCSLTVSLILSTGYFPH